MFKSGFIAIVGRPNAGKSTLLNALLDQEISIVTPKAQTTRDQVLGILTQPDRGQIVFVDTPGVHRAKQGGINEAMMDQVRTALEAPEVIWYVMDPASKLEHEAAVIDLLAKAEAPVLVLMNKIDRTEVAEGTKAGKKASFLLPSARVEELEASVREALQNKGVEVLGWKRISALTRDGVAELLDHAWALLPEGLAFFPDPDQVSDRPVRFFVAEKIREQLLKLLGDEVPYSCAVEIEKFDEHSKPIRIEANIHVERESQKGIVIGEGAKKIKEIGQAARFEIEKFLGSQIFLGLKVKLLKDWSRDPEALSRMGYFLPKKERVK
ncbi:MAG: GTPase Era [Bdellovibrionia bacterium]